MARDIAAGMVTEITAAQVRLGVFAYLDFPSGAVRVWDGVSSIAWNSQTWTGVGTLGSISWPRETTLVRAEGCVLSLSGVASAMISAVLADKVRGRAAQVWLNTLSGGSVSNSLNIFTGRMDHTTIAEQAGGDDDTCVVNVHCESHLIDLGRASEWRYSHEHQQQLFPGDDGFEFAATIQDQELNWMSPGAQRSIPVSTKPTRRP